MGPSTVPRYRDPWRVQPLTEGKDKRTAISRSTGAGHPRPRTSGPGPGLRRGCARGVGNRLLAAGPFSRAVMPGLPAGRQA